MLDVLLVSLLLALLGLLVSLLLALFGILVSLLLALLRGLRRGRLDCFCRRVASTQVPNQAVRDGISLAVGTACPYSVYG